MRRMAGPSAAVRSVSSRAASTSASGPTQPGTDKRPAERRRCLPRRRAGYVTYTAVLVPAGTRPPFAPRAGRPAVGVPSAQVVVEVTGQEGSHFPPENASVSVMMRATWGATWATHTCVCAGG